MDDLGEDVSLLVFVHVKYTILNISLNSTYFTKTKELP